MTLKEAYSYSVSFLKLNGVDEEEFKALCVCCHIAGISNSEYPFHKDDFVPNKRLDGIVAEQPKLEGRQQGIPMK